MLVLDVINLFELGVLLPFFKLRLLLGLQFTSGGQGALTHCTVSSSQISSLWHPPLSNSQDGSQNASPVPSSTLQVEPRGHETPIQGLSAPRGRMECIAYHDNII